MRPNFYWTTRRSYSLRRFHGYGNGSCSSRVPLYLLFPLFVNVVDLTSLTKLTLSVRRAFPELTEPRGKHLSPDC